MFALCDIQVGGDHPAVGGGHAHHLQRHTITRTGALKPVGKTLFGHVNAHTHDLFNIPRAVFTTLCIEAGQVHKGGSWLGQLRRYLQQVAKLLVTDFDFEVCIHEADALVDVADHQLQQRRLVGQLLFALAQLGGARLDPQFQLGTESAQGLFTLAWNGHIGIRGNHATTWQGLAYDFNDGAVRAHPLKPMGQKLRRQLDPLANLCVHVARAVLPAGGQKTKALCNGAPRATQVQGEVQHLPEPLVGSHQDQVGAHHCKTDIELVNAFEQQRPLLPHSLVNHHVVSKSVSDFSEF